MNQVGVKSIGYTDDGLVFFQVVTVYKDEPLETTLQFAPDDAAGFCKCIEEAITKAREKRKVDN